MGEAARGLLAYLHNAGNQQFTQDCENRRRREREREEEEERRRRATMPSTESWARSKNVARAVDAANNAPRRRKTLMSDLKVGERIKKPGTKGQVVQYWQPALGSRVNPNKEHDNSVPTVESLGGPVDVPEVSAEDRADFIASVERANQARRDVEEKLKKYGGKGLPGESCDRRPESLSGVARVSALSPDRASDRMVVNRIDPDIDGDDIEEVVRESGLRTLESNWIGTALSVHDDVREVKQ